MIQYLDWDSIFFGRNIGKLEMYNNIWPGKEEFLNYDLVYIFSDLPIKKEVPLMDVKITYIKQTGKKFVAKNIVEYNPTLHSYQELVDLAYLSGHESRFLKDSFFSENQFKKLYKRWIDNSISDIKTLVLVFVIDHKIQGFVTVTKMDEEAFIGLIAVAVDSQGTGIGVKLIDAVETHLDDGTSLTVATQETNKSACIFYEKAGFSILKKQYIYHYASNVV